MSLLANTELCRYVCTDPILEEIGQCNWLCQKRKNPTSRINHGNYGPRQTQLLCGLFFIHFFFPHGHSICEMDAHWTHVSIGQIIPRQGWQAALMLNVPGNPPCFLRMFILNLNSAVWTAGCGSALRLFSLARLLVITTSEDKVGRVTRAYRKEKGAKLLKYQAWNSTCYLQNCMMSRKVTIRPAGKWGRLCWSLPWPSQLTYSPTAIPKGKREEKEIKWWSQETGTQCWLFNRLHLHLICGPCDIHAVCCLFMLLIHLLLCGLSNLQYPDTCPTAYKALWIPSYLFTFLIWFFPHPMGWVLLYGIPVVHTTNRVNLVR